MSKKLKWIFQVIKTFYYILSVCVVCGEKSSNWVKGEMLQKSLEATQLDIHSLVNNLSNLKKEPF